MEHITVKRVEPLDGFRLRLTFSDGLVGEVEVDPGDRGPMFGPLRDPAFIRHVRARRAAGTVVWPNGLALAPEVHRDRAQGSAPATR